MVQRAQHRLSPGRPDFHQSARGQQGGCVKKSNCSTFLQQKKKIFFSHPRSSWTNKRCAFPCRKWKCGRRRTDSAFASPRRKMAVERRKLFRCYSAFTLLTIFLHFSASKAFFSLQFFTCSVFFFWIYSVSYGDQRGRSRAAWSEWGQGEAGRLHRHDGTNPGGVPDNIWRKRLGTARFTTWRKWVRGHPKMTSAEG